MSYAIRFRPRDPSDPSPALYLSTDPQRPNRHGARVTSVQSDVLRMQTERGAFLLSGSPYVAKRCARDRLVADVVPLADALRDLGDVEPRP